MRDRAYRLNNEINSKSERGHNMPVSSELRHKLSRDGFLLKENLLPESVFMKHKEAVVSSWNNRDGWTTRFKAEDEERIMPVQSDGEMSKVAEIVRLRHNEHKFQYLYHSLIESMDEQGLVLDIVQDVRKAWSEEIEIFAPLANNTRFSLTAFTEDCFLDPHNDHSEGEDTYLVTLLLYFGSETCASGGGLTFNYGNKRQTIEAKRNLGVFFVPSRETEHWVEPLLSDASPRLALSGWLY